MGFFDKYNPFKKKDDLGLPPLDSNPGFNDTPAMPSGTSMPDLGANTALPSADMGLGQDPLSSTQNSFDTHQSPRLNDTRMNMPMGESLRQNPQNNFMDNPNLSQNSQNHSTPQVNGSVNNNLQKDLEIISSKLDYLKASLEAVNQRIANLEHLSKQNQNNNRW
jgi:hypothetical protein